MYNLISNSIKYKSGQPPVINIYTAMDEDKIVLRVQDNGMGMSEGELDKIFNMYGRLHRDIEGQGIGLYLAKKIADAAGGNILVQSAPGKGTTFIIYFKRETENKKNASEPALYA